MDEQIKLALLWTIVVCGGVMMVIGVTVAVFH